MVTVPVEPPTPKELARIAAEYGFDLTDEQIAQYALLAGPTLQAFARLDELPLPTLPVKYPRTPGYRPPPEENPHGGWAWRCSIKGAAEGPLAGQRVGIKDNVCVAGVPMLNGSPIMEGYVPREDATVVTRLLDAGAEIVGKTAVPAFCFDGGGLTGYPEPQPTNPYDRAYLCGASSNGSAVVVVTGEADLALGGDQGGSIRLPSSWSGCCGIKATHGLVPYTGIFPIERTLDHVGPMARTVADCALMLQVIAGPDGLDPRQIDVRTETYSAALDRTNERGLEGMRIGVLREGFGIPGVSEPDVDEAVRSAADTLAGGGADVEEVSVPMHADGLAIWNGVAVEGATDLMVRGNAFGTNWSGHYSLDLVDFYSRARRTRGRDYSPTVKITVLLGAYLAERYGHHYYAKAQNLGRELRARYAEALERVDVLLMPTTAMKALAWPAERDLPNTLASALGNLHNTAPFDVTGNPALSMPCALSQGRPVGLMLVGRHWEESAVLRVGHAYEQLRGPLPKPPLPTDGRDLTEKDKAVRV
ncbi:MAG: amidase [Streptosporangiales bacterium]|nr:amidase [Streptosporangiales bacterium]